MEQKSPKVKQIKFKINTSEHDLNTKIRNAERQMAKGHHVKFTIEVRGRIASLLTRKEVTEKLERIIEPYKKINIWSKGDNYFALVKAK